MPPKPPKPRTQAGALDSLSYICVELFAEMLDAREKELDMDSFYLNAIALFWGLSDAIEFDNKHPEEIMEIAILVLKSFLNEIEKGVIDQ